MIYEIYLNDSIVIIWDDSKIEKIVRYKKYRDGIYLAGEDETIGKLAPFAKKLFELIISKYKMNNNFQDNGYQQYEIPGINIYAIIKGYNKYEDGGDISEEIKSNYYSENYTNIINNISRRISELNGRSIFKELQNDDGRIYNNWYTTYPRRQDGDDYKFKTSLKINVINPDVRLIDIEWLSDERSGSDYVSF